MQLAVMIC